MLSKIVIAACQLLLLFSPQAYSGGGHVVGNGGGSAELSVAQIWKTFNMVLEPCLFTDLCHLNSEQKRIVSEALALRGQCYERVKFKASFDEHKFSVSRCTEDVVINSRFLYDGKKPKSLTSLLGFSIETLLNIYFLDSQMEIKEMNYLEISEVLIQVDFWKKWQTQSQVTRSVVVLEDSESMNELKVYCDGAEEINFKQAILNKLGCEIQEINLLKIHNMSLERVTQDKLLFQSELEVSCRSQNMKKTLMIELGEGCHSQSKVTLW